jgi:DnaJ-class molecular chaperone
MTDLYEVLEITKDADDKTITKAYRKLSKKWHPDKNPNKKQESEEKFKKIAEAYEILSNPEKRSLYDNGGLDNVKESEEFDPIKLFTEFMSEMDTVPDVINPLSVQIDDLFTGKEINCEIERYDICESCHGKGTTNGIDAPCKKCNGSGTAINVTSGQFIKRVSCQLCRGTGIDPSVQKCKICKGEKCCKHKVTLPVKIPNGCYDKYPIVIEGEGNELPEDEAEKLGYKRSDAVFIIDEQEHETFKRNFFIDGKDSIDPSDLLIQLNITFAESITGFYKEIKFIDNSDIIINITDPVRHNDIFVIKSKGMPKFEEESYGDLFIQVNVQHPKDLNLKFSTKQKIWQILTCTSLKSYTTRLNCEKIITFDEYKLELNLKKQNI